MKCQASSDNLACLPELVLLATLVVLPVYYIEERYTQFRLQCGGPIFYHEQPTRPTSYLNLIPIRLLAKELGLACIQATAMSLLNSSLTS